jgi:hypothetical protein
VEVEAKVEITGPDPDAIRRNILQALAEAEERARESAIVEGEEIPPVE